MLSNTEIRSPKSSSSRPLKKRGIFVAMTESTEDALPQAPQEAQLCSESAHLETEIRGLSSIKKRKACALDVLWQAAEKVTCHGTSTSTTTTGDAAKKKSADITTASSSSSSRRKKRKKKKSKKIVEIANFPKPFRKDSSTTNPMSDTKSLASFATSTTAASTAPSTGGCSTATSAVGSPLSSLAEAAVKVTTLEDRKARKRQMDMKYARQRRMREKEEATALKHECVRLADLNLAVRKDNERLEQMLQDASNKVSLVEYGMAIATSQEEYVSELGDGDSTGQVCKEPAVVVAKEMKKGVPTTTSSATQVSVESTLSSSSGQKEVELHQVQHILNEIQGEIAKQKAAASQQALVQQLCSALAPSPPPPPQQAQPPNPLDQLLQLIQGQSQAHMIQQQLVQQPQQQPAQQLSLDLLQLLLPKNQNSLNLSSLHNNQAMLPARPSQPVNPAATPDATLLQQITALTSSSSPSIQAQPRHHHHQMPVQSVPQQQLQQQLLPLLMMQQRQQQMQNMVSR